MSLQQLPPELLQHLCQHLKTQPEPPGDLQSLRCTCKALRDAITPCISGTCICVHGDLPPVDSALLQLSRFPASAVLRNLEWKRVLASDPVLLMLLFDLPPATHPTQGQLAAFLHKAPAHRLSFITSFEATCTVSVKG